jgi:hypothetical protein
VKYGAADLERIFAEQLVAVGRALSELGGEYMLIGGLAIGVWSSPRATTDCDLSVRVPASSEALRDSLARAGLEVMRGDLTRAQAAGEAVRLRRQGHTEEPVVVDLLFATTPFEIEALARRQPLRVLGVEVPVATPEDLLVFKLIAARPQDLADAHVLFTLHGAAFDLERVRRWCREFGVEDRLDVLLSPE